MSLTKYSVQNTLSKKFKEPLSILYIHVTYLQVLKYRSILWVPPEEFDIFISSEITYTVVLHDRRIIDIMPEFTYKYKYKDNILFQISQLCPLS